MGLQLLGQEHLLGL